MVEFGDLEPLAWSRVVLLVWMGYTSTCICRFEPKSNKFRKNNWVISIYSSPYGDSKDHNGLKE